MRAYRALLRLYPASFRAEYGGEMAAIFARRRRDAAGILAVGALWLDEIRDVLANAARVHGDILLQDLRYTTRTLRRAPGFAVTVTIVAALGIGATTAAFSIANHVLIRPLPFPEPDRLVRLWQDQSYRGYLQMELSPGNYRDWKSQATSFDGMGAYASRSMNLIGSGNPERLDGAMVTWDLLGVLGVSPLRGRLFNREDDVDGADGTVILSERLWTNRFGADEAVIGRKILLDSAPYTVIGIMPGSFHFPGREIDFWSPIRFTPRSFDDRTDTFIYPIARLKPGVTLAEARTEMSAVAAQLERAYPRENARTGAFVHRLSDQVSARSRLMLTAMIGASICVLLIACTNLANLLIARALMRQREIAVRVAIGAGTDRLVRQMLTESLVLAAAGGLAGVLLAVATAPLVARLVPTTLPIAEVPGVDLRVLAFAAAITIVTGIGFGIVPALRVRKTADGSLRESSRTGAGRATERIRSALVVAEVVGCVVLLIAAGLLLSALQRVQATDPGFNTDGVLTMRTMLPLPKYAETEKRVQFYRQVIADLRALPGVTQAAYASSLPMVWRGGIWAVTPDGRPPDPSAKQTASVRFVTPGYFQALGIPLRQGRDLSDADDRGAQMVAVVSESFGREHWPNQDPIGRRFNIAFSDRVVVGVVGDVRVRGLERVSEPQVYLPPAQVADGALPVYAPRDLVIRSTAPASALVPAVRQIVARADPDQPISDIRTLAAIIEAETGPRRVQVRALGLFAAVAFVLAALGIHGLLAFNVSSRTREIGVRIALGAQRRDILIMIARHATFLALIGVALAVPIGHAAGRQMESLLAGVSPADLTTIATAVALAVVMTTLGGLLPALRATRVDPITAIRVE